MGIRGLRQKLCNIQKGEVLCSWKKVKKKIYKSRKKGKEERMDLKAQNITNTNTCTGLQKRQVYE